MRSPVIQTRYKGYRFRSRLEARWAVFFDHLGVKYDYETQGYVVGGIPYLPDFLLTDCGTWVEVKGDERELDHDLMRSAAEHLPYKDCKKTPGPRLLILGSIPDPPETGDLGWIGIGLVEYWRGEVPDGDRTYACSIRRGERWCECGHRVDGPDPRNAGDLCKHLTIFARRHVPGLRGEKEFIDHWWGFGGYHERLCPRILTETSQSTPVDDDQGDWLTPAIDEYAEFDPKVAAAYEAARAARFEHGESGA